MTGAYRTVRIVTLGLGLLFGVGAIWKIVAWPQSVAAMEVYQVLRFIPLPLLTAAGVAAELFVAFTLLHDRHWRRIGLPSIILFLTSTGLVLAWQVTAGGGSDCGCLPFLPRSISWWAVTQNLAAALFLWGMWGTVEVEGTATGGAQLPGQPASG